MKQGKFYVLTKNGCPYCEMLKGAMMVYYKIDTLEKLYKKVNFFDASDSYDFLESVGDGVVPSSYRTVPQVVYMDENGNSYFVGGFTDFLKAVKTGKL